MFEINEYLIGKMGWVQYSMSRGIGVHYTPYLSKVIQPFADDPLVKFFFDVKDHYICFIIKEFSEKEKKQNRETSYKFIIMEYNPDIVIDGQPKFTISEFSSNSELFGLINKYKACNSEYQRYFKLNNILK